MSFGREAVSSGEVQGTLQDQQSDDEGIVPAIEDSFDIPAVEMYAHPVPIEVFVSRRDKQNAFGLEGKKLRPTFDGILNGFVTCPLFCEQSSHFSSAGSIPYKRVSP